LGLAPKGCGEGGLFKGKGGACFRSSAIFIAMGADEKARLPGERAGARVWFASVIANSRLERKKSGFINSPRWG